MRRTGRPKGEAPARGVTHPAEGSVATGAARPLPLRPIAFHLDGGREGRSTEL
ncbi:MAG: hypothetical protein HY287_03585 [Planctomycetes bacterium]|nr:hypothetical protein [Planctomycetota bacterium]MBI3833393.1 hypothetical protein [Planctomycetota bacterium]